MIGAIRDHLICQFLQTTVVGSGKAGKGDFIVAGIFQRFHCLTEQHLRTLLTDRAAGVASLTEPAATDATTEHLQIGTVVNDLSRRNNHLYRPVGIVQILHDPLGNHTGSAIHGSDGGKGTVRIVAMLVERGYIHTGDLGNFMKECILTPAFSLGTVVQRHDLHSDVLALTQREEVNKVRQRLRIVSADTARKDDILQVVPVTAVQRNARQIQHIQDIGIGHLIANGEGDHIKILHRILTFQCPQRQVICPHGAFHIAPGSKDALTPDTVHLVHHTVENPHTQIGHADLVGIRKTECHADTDIFLILFDLIEFAAGISCRFLDSRQNSLQ